MSHRASKNKTSQNGEKSPDLHHRPKGLFGEERKNSTTAKIFSILIIGLLIWSFASIGLNLYSFVKLNDVRKMDSRMDSVLSNSTLSQSDKFRSIDSICISAKSLSNACLFLGAVKTGDVYFCGEISDDNKRQDGTLVKEFCYKKLLSDSYAKNLPLSGISFVIPDRSISLTEGITYRFIFPVHNGLDRGVRAKPVFSSSSCSSGKDAADVAFAKSSEKNIPMNSTMDFVVELDPKKLDARCIGSGISVRLEITDPANPVRYYVDGMNSTFIIERMK